jgi:hypothetical protein
LPECHYIIFTRRSQRSGDAGGFTQRRKEENEGRKELLTLITWFVYGVTKITRYKISIDIQALRVIKELTTHSKFTN